MTGRRLVKALLICLPLTSALALAGCGGRRSPAPATPARPVAAVRRVAAKLGALTAEQLRDAAKSANLVIVVMDAARADHVGCYGYPRPTTPNVDRLAEESVVFENCLTTFSQTKPSTAALFTGLYPDTHLVSENASEVSTGAPTLPEGLKAAGFETVLCTSNPVVSNTFGMGAGFGRTLESFPHLRKTAGGKSGSGRQQWTGNPQTPEALVGEFERWLGDGRKPRFFAYVHFLPPHIPYDAPDEMKRLFTGKPPNAWEGSFPFPEVDPQERHRPPPSKEKWVNLYDANLRWADWGVGEIVRLLQDHGLLDNTLLIVLADHGEAFYEHGYRFHARGVYDELVHVPLVIRLPGEKRLRGRVPALAQTVDLLPTVFDLFGFRLPRELQGESLVPLLTNEAQTVRDYAYATCTGTRPSYLVRDREYALILFEGGILRALYDMRADPRQTVNVIGQRPEVAARMASAFRAFAATQRRPPLQFVDRGWKAKGPASGPRAKMSDEQRRQLRSLGYVE